ncbi:MAG: hypothetical protein H6838_09250 [Planctomycetes bacterium]|nr:hypothetical protein [Planctomycetota bacterium]
MLAAQQQPVVDGAPRSGDLVEALRHGTFGGRLRYRLDYLEQDGKPEDALASTLRTELHYTTQDWHGLTAFVEVYANESLGADDYFGITNGKSGAEYPLIADPEGGGLNRGWLRWRDPGARAEVVVGRQFLHWNDGRMLGNSFYRQNQNTFDAVRVTLRPAAGVEFDYAWLWRHDDVFFRSFGMDSHVAQLAWTVPERCRLAGYATWIDYDARDTFDRDTYGVRLGGPYALAQGLGLHYTLEYAHQSDAGDNPFDVDADYLVAELGVAFAGQLVYVGYNAVDGVRDPSTALPFDQPAGYPYPFRGETEQMVVTPAAGMQIVMLRALGPVPGAPDFSWQLHLHHFAQQVGGLDYGTDLGVQLAYAPAGRGWSVFAKAARYWADDAASGAVDTTRLLLGAEITF